MELIQQGVDKGLIIFDTEQKYITYIHQGKRRNYGNPEEKVQAAAFLKLVLTYGYAPERIEQFVPVKIGSDTREADIIVYNNNEHTSARIVVECKKVDVSEREFEQAFSYAGTVRAEYFWVTSGIKDAYFQIPEEEPKEYRPVADVPQYGADELTRRFKQAHDALWGGGELNPSEAFDELDKLIFLINGSEPLGLIIYTKQSRDCSARHRHPVARQRGHYPRCQRRFDETPHRPHYRSR